jgi:single-strand DNA-binding protein
MYSFKSPLFPSFIYFCCPKNHIMKKIQIIGNVTKDAEVRSFEGGRSVINFDVAVNERFKDRNGQKQERTSYIRCAMWRDSQYTNIAQYITKGTKVYVEGSPDVDAYINKEGKAVGNVKINVREFEFLSSGKKSESENSDLPTQSEDMLTPSANDDLPF